MLYEKLGRPALSKTRRLLRRQGVAEEIVHDVFVSMWQKKPVFTSLRAAYAWVYRSCTNKAIDYLRGKNQQNISIDEISIEDEHTSPAEERLFLKKALLTLVKKMSAREASVFIYTYLEGLGQEEMAEVMDLSRSTIVRVQTSVNEKLSQLKEEQNE